MTDATGADAPISILIVEDEGIIAEDLRETVLRLGYEVAGVACEGSQAVAMARDLHPDLVVMDVNLRGDLDGIQAACLIQETAATPIIFLTGHSDQATLERAVLTGPMGYLVKPLQDIELRCAIEVAIHKHRADALLREREEELRRNARLLETLSLIDELTQLRNRRGFFDLAEQALKVARREQHSLALFFLDLNELKRINDSFGHLVGDQALRDAAGVVRDTFRDSDIIARIGGDEFVALAHVSGDVRTILQRLQQHLDAFNASSNRPYRLSFSVGTVSVDPTEEDNLETLIGRADAAMYRNKRERKPAD